MFEDADQKKAPRGPTQAGQPLAPPPTPIIEKPPLEDSPFQVKSPEKEEDSSLSAPDVLAAEKLNSGSSRKGRVIILIGLLVVVLAVIGGGVYYFFFRSAGEEGTTNAPANQVVNQNKNESQTNINVSLLNSVIQPDKWDDKWIASQFGDNDNDGLNLFGETWFGTDEKKADSDGDSYNDGSELGNGYHPGKQGKKIEMSLIKEGCQDLLASAYQDDLPEASDQKKVCELTPSLFESTKELGLLTTGTKETLVSYYQDLIDLCENEFTKMEKEKSCVTILKAVDLIELEPVGLIPGF